MAGVLDRITDPQALALFREALGSYHNDLAEAEMRFGLSWVTRREGDDSDEPLLKTSSGYPAIAKVERVPPKYRLHGAPDALITVDRAQYHARPEDQQLAVWDHELTHVELEYDREGGLKSDDGGRPKFKYRPHDYELGGFKSVVDRHGRAAVEAVAFRRIARGHRQLLLDLDDPDDLAADEPGDGEGSVVREAVAALVAVGHEPERAARLVNRAAEGRVYESVNELVDAVYRLTVSEPAPA